MAKRRSDAKGIESYLFNFAAIGVGATTVLLAVFGMRSKEVAPVCSERYGVATQFSLQRSAGEPASAVELQSRLGGRDWGVAENASIEKTPDGPSALALKVRMSKPAATAVNGTSGLGFTWLQSDAPKASAACLTYQVMLPKDFDYGEGGVLPGVFGGATSAAPKDGKEQVKSSFGTHLLWGKDGGLSLRMAMAGETADWGVKPLGPVQQPFLDVGRWVPIEQEIVLNSAGMSNGLLRVWIDGQLKLELSNIAWRTDESSLLQGVDVRAHFARGTLAPSPAPVATDLRLSPVEARWLR
jgi:hypothetical protein